MHRDYLDAIAAQPSGATDIAASPETLVHNIVETWGPRCSTTPTGIRGWGTSSRWWTRPGTGGCRTGARSSSPAFGTALVLVQVGDGDVLAVRGDGNAHRPIGPARNLVGGETLSLAGEDAAGDASCVVLELDDAIRMVLLATDGYANSFDDADWAQLIGADYMQLLQDHGPAWIGAQLPEWVEASAAAAGDDVTVLMAVRG